jgi:hypothetical protein
MRKILQSSLILLLAFTTAFAQDRTVSGTVTGADDGTSLPGVNVLVKGTSSGAITDLDGKYKFSIPSEGGILMFSFIGLVPQEIEVGSKSVIDLQMVSNTEQLEEVVVTAYSTTLKTEFTEASASVSSETLDRLPIVSADQNPGY